jgi:MFS family permease
MRRAGERALVAAGLVACAGGALLLITAWLPLVLAASAALGLCIVWINVGAITLIQRRTPADLLGRVDAALEFAIIVPQAASIAVGAALIAVVNYRILLLAMAGVIAFSAGYLVSGREQRFGQTVASASPQADSMPGEPAGKS